MLPPLSGCTLLGNYSQQAGIKTNTGVLHGVFLPATRFKDKIEFCLSEGLPILIENLGDNVPEVLDPILEKQFLKKGKRLYVTFMDQQVDYNPAFALYMTTKLANPHFSPEINAKCTMIDFTVMHEGISAAVANVPSRQATGVVDP